MSSPRIRIHDGDGNPNSFSTEHLTMSGEEQTNKCKSCDKQDTQVPVVTPTKKKPSDEAARDDTKAPAANVNERQGDKPSDTAVPAAATSNNTQPHNDVAAPPGEQVVTGDTVLGFQRHPNLSNREILLQQQGFVQWARKQQNPNSQNLVAFKIWLNSSEAKSLANLANRGNETFPFGQHKGLKFAEIAMEDPEYHERYMRALRAKNRAPSEVLSRYIRFYNDWSRVQKFSSGQKKRKATNAATRQQSEAANKRSQYRRELSMRRNERFPFGQHRGQPFWMVARDDPSYHLRFKVMDDSPNEVLDRYIEWFNEYGPGPHVAAQAEHEFLGVMLGVHPALYGNNYQDDDY